MLESFLSNVITKKMTYQNTQEVCSMATYIKGKTIVLEKERYDGYDQFQLCRSDILK